MVPIYKNYRIETEAEGQNAEYNRENALILVILSALSLGCLAAEVV